MLNGETKKRQRTIQELIIDRALRMNNNAFQHYETVNISIKKLNMFIDGDTNIGKRELEDIIVNLTQNYTIPLHIPIEKGLKFTRAVKFDGSEPIPCFTKVNRLSYIPTASTITRNIGRLNPQGKSMYYGCIYFNDNWGGLNVAFSEIDAHKHEHINILKSTSVKDLNLYCIGIFDHIRRGIRQSFIPDNIYSYYEKIFEYKKEYFKDYVLVAHQLCEAFFSDILRRAKNDNLFMVTSTLSTILTKNENIDGILYSSQKAEDSPVVAIKTKSIDEKVIHLKAISFRILEDCGYAIYKAKSLYEGIIRDGNIEWAHIVTEN